MGANYLTQLAQWCREAGLAVVEYDGWEHRARSSGGYESDRPWAIMWHHTASKTSPENDASYMCHGSGDKPIANIPVNHVEANAGTYALPDPLTMAYGKPVRDWKTWVNKRRPEIVRLFEENQFGRAPERPLLDKKKSFEVFEHAAPLRH